MGFKSIVVSIEDPKIPSELGQAVKLAAPGARIHVLYATEDVALEPAAEVLGKGLAPVAHEQAISQHVRRGARDQETLRLAVEADADLIVLGAYHSDAARTISRVMAWAACSVLVLAPDAEGDQAKGFVPPYPTCTACSKQRDADHARWYCDQHQDPERHLYRCL